MPLGRSMTNRKKMAVTDKNSREAITHYEVIAQYRACQCILEPVEPIRLGCIWAMW